MSNGKVALIILDGYGIGEPNDGNAIYMAQTPVMDGLLQRWPHTKLSASGLDVGLPDGQMGNSEVGHTNIGAGRVVFQDLPRISKSIEDGDFFENPAYLDAMRACRENGSALHLMGLLSDGGVHSHIDHLFALMKMAKEQDKAPKESDDTKGKKKKLKTAASVVLTEEEELLFEALRGLRTEIAREESVPPYIVFSDKTLVLMCRLRPENKAEMLEVSGVGEHKFEKYGARFLQRIAEHV